MKFIQQTLTKVIYRHVCLILALLVYSLNAYAQDSEINVTGTVIDNEGYPLAGASLVIEGTTRGTVTDSDGNFTLDILPGTVLQVSFISFESKQVLINENTNLPLRITMVHDVLTLNETVIVAVGYGTMRRGDLTGSIASVSGDKLREGVITSTEQILQGRIAGLSVVQGGGDPTKGASLRLRGGTSLTASSDPLVVVDGIPGVDINTIHPSDVVSVDVLKDASAAAIYGSRGANGVIIVTTNREVKGKAVNYSGSISIGQAANQLDLLSANQWRARVRDENIVSAVDYGGNTNWQEELLRTSITQSHNVAFSNIGEDSGFRASINYMDNQGVIERSNLERIGASLSAFQKGLNNKLRLEVGLTTNYDQWHPLRSETVAGTGTERYTMFERIYNLNPTVPVYDSEGKFTRVAGTLVDNPVEINNNRSAKDKRNRLLAYAKTELELLPGLTSTTNLSFGLNSHKSNQYLPSYAVMGGESENGWAQKTLAESTYKQIESFVTYDHTYDVHRINLLGGYSFLENFYEGFGAHNRNFDSDFFKYHRLQAGQGLRSGDVYSYKSANRLVSFFGRANYSYDGKYMATATLRRDGSSRFGANEKWGLFPSGSLAWRISGENFMDATSAWLENLKLRLGYGVTGNQDAVPSYRSLATYDAGNIKYYDATSQTWVFAFSPSQNANPDLKWESTEQINIGLDFALFRRVTGVVEVYQKTTKDLLYNYQVPATQYPVDRLLANVGELSNKGIELTLNAAILRNRSLTWDVDFTLAHNQLTIEKLSNDTYQTDDVPAGNLHGLPGLSGIYSQVLKEGQTIGTFVDGTGNILGDAQPDLNLSLNMYFSYRNFDASLATYGMLGQKVLNATAMVLSGSERFPSQNVLKNYFDLPQDVSSTEVSDYWVEDASFLRLQSVTLGYTLPALGDWFERARVYVTGENLFVLTNYSGIDPEINYTGLDHPGIDMLNYYPRPRALTFGVNLTF